MNSGEAAAKQGVEVQASWKAIRRSKTAFTIKELVGLSSDFSKHRQDGSKRTSGCTARVLRTERSKFLMVYNVTCTEKDSNPAGHTVRLKFDFKRLKESGKASDLAAEVTASGRSLPERTSGTAGGTLLTAMSMCPPTASCTSGPEPL